MRNKPVLRLLAVLLCAAALFVSASQAATREIRIPLKEGKLHVADLSSAICHAMELPSCPLGRGDIDLNGPRGAVFIEAVNLSLGQSGRVTLDASHILLRVDTDRLASRCENMSRAVRVLAAEANPEATRRQAAHWGLFLPEHFDPARPLVVLVHGLDSDRQLLQPIGDLIAKEGNQVAYFCYPGDQPIDDSAATLAQKLAVLHAQYPAMKIDIIAHSMGGLVARAYVEGDRYAGGVDRLVLVGTPNSGSGWARARCLLSVAEQYNLWRTDPDWSASWWFTEGFGEAGRDLLPDSPFIKRLAALPRRQGVRYTIIAGTQSTTRRWSAECLESMAGWFTGRGATWWGLRHCKNGLSRAAANCRSSTGDDDGPVSVESAKLKGVDDVVLLPADHLALFVPIGNRPPVAWEAIKQRLASDRRMSVAAVEKSAR